MDYQTSDISRYIIYVKYYLVKLTNKNHRTIPIFEEINEGNYCIYIELFCSNRNFISILIYK